MLGHSQHLAVRRLKDVVQGDWKGRNTKRVSSTLEAKWNVFKEWVNLTDSNAGGRSSKNKAKIGLIKMEINPILVLFFREWFPRRIGMKAWLECFQENMRAVILCPQECALNWSAQDLSTSPSFPCSPISSPTRWKKLSWTRRNLPKLQAQGCSGGKGTGLQKEGGSLNSYSRWLKDFSSP